MYAEAFEVGRLPLRLQEALILLFLKPDKPPNQTDSYRPLSLINLDSKILPKVLAVWLCADQIHGPQSMHFLCVTTPTSTEYPGGCSVLGCN